MHDFAVAFALVFVIEGIFYALAPALAQRLMMQLLYSSPEQLRKAGLILAAIGVIIITLLRR